MTLGRRGRVILWFWVRLDENAGFAWFPLNGWRDLVGPFENGKCRSKLVVMAV